MNDRVAERREQLWMLTVSPTVWGLHFMASYVTAAVWCGKLAGPGESLLTVRMAIAGYTVVALAIIGFVGWVGYSRHRLDGADLPHDDDTPEDRHRFMGYATLLLSALSGVATIYSALAAVFIETCH